MLHTVAGEGGVGGDAGGRFDCGGGDTGLGIGCPVAAVLFGCIWLSDRVAREEDIGAGRRTMCKREEIVR